MVRHHTNQTDLIGDCRPLTSARGRGFSLIETLVSVALFSIVMLVAVGSLVTVIDANQKARTLKLVMNNLHASLEYMSRHIRDGQEYAISGGGTQISFTHRGAPMTFALQGGQIVRTNGGGQLPLTAPNVRIDTLYFEQIIHPNLDDQQPKILITIEGVAGEDNPKIRSEFSIQTTVSQRLQFVARVAITGGSSAPANPACQFGTAPGRYYINMELNNIPKQSVDVQVARIPITADGYNYRGPYQPEPNEEGQRIIPAGTYDITLVSWDNHCDPDDQIRNSEEEVIDCRVNGNPSGSLAWHNTQNYEQIRMRIAFPSGTTWDSNMTDDIPDQQMQNIKQTDVGVTFAEPIEGFIVLGMHGWKRCDYDPSTPPCSPYRAQSLVPICAVLDTIGTGGAQPIEIEEF